MSEFQRVVVAAGSVANGSSLTVDGTESGTGAAIITEFAADGDGDVYREVDSNGDGTFDVSVLIDQGTNNWHSQGNQLGVSAADNSRLRVENTSGGSASITAIGYEVTQ